jgi:hypothetical protein
MELVTILLSGLMGIVSVGGVVVDEVAESTIRDQLSDVERLSVRIDNTPSYQFAQGRIDRIRIAGRGLYPVEGVRVEVLDIETDAIALDVANLADGQDALEEPLRAAVRLVMTQEDIEQALTAPWVTEQLQALTFTVSDDVSDSTPTDPSTALVIDPQLTLLNGNRLQLNVVLPNADETVVIALEFRLELVSGAQLAVTDFDLTINEQAVPDSVQSAAIAILEQQLDLSRWESSGILARYVDVTIRDRTLTIVGFVELIPNS